MAGLGAGAEGKGVWDVSVVWYLFPVVGSCRPIEGMNRSICCLPIRRVRFVIAVVVLLFSDP